MAKKSKNAPDDKDVYLAFTNIFAGPNSEVRKKSDIKKLVRRNEKLPEVALLLGKHGFARAAVYGRIKALLEDQVFGSHLHAKLRFPDLFAASPAQTAEREASEAEAAIDHARAVEEALESKLGDDAAEESDETCQAVVPPKPLVPASPSAPAQDHSNSQLPRPEAHSLFPMRLPFITGHKLVAQVQAILERACFDFAARALPEFLQKRGWDCAEAVELNIWMKTLRGKRSSFRNSVSNSVLSQDSFYRSIADIRHTAVHRLPVTANGIHKFLLDSMVLATLLDDETALGKLSGMECELKRVMYDMEGHKNMLETRMNKTLGRIAAERAELDRQEKEAVVNMMEADREYQLYAAISLQEKLAAREVDDAEEVPRTQSDDGTRDTSEEGEELTDGSTVEDFGDFDILLALGIPNGEK